jgi:hypothetical protein
MIILIRPSNIQNENARLNNKNSYNEVFYISNNHRKITAIILLGSRHNPNIKR